MPTKTTSKKNSTAQIVCKAPDDVKKVKALPDYCLEVQFVDGTFGTVFMKELIFSESAGVFSGLQDPVMFNQVFVEYGVTTWPGEIDLAPDAMYAAIKRDGVWVLK